MTASQNDPHFSPDQRHKSVRLYLQQILKLRGGLLQKRTRRRELLEILAGSPQKIGIARVRQVLSDKEEITLKRVYSLRCETNAFLLKLRGQFANTPEGELPLEPWIIVDEIADPEGAGHVYFLNFEKDFQLLERMAKNSLAAGTTQPLPDIALLQFLQSNAKEKISAHVPTFHTINNTFKSEFVIPYNWEMDPQQASSAPSDIFLDYLRHSITHSHQNWLVLGGSGSGKSYLAAMLYDRFSRSPESPLAFYLDLKDLQIRHAEDFSSLKTIFRSYLRQGQLRENEADQLADVLAEGVDSRRIILILDSVDEILYFLQDRLLRHNFLTSKLLRTASIIICQDSYFDLHLSSNLELRSRTIVRLKDIEINRKWAREYLDDICRKDKRPEDTDQSLAYIRKHPNITKLATCPETVQWLTKILLANNELADALHDPIDIRLRYADHVFQLQRGRGRKLDIERAHLLLAAIAGHMHEHRTDRINEATMRRLAQKRNAGDDELHSILGFLRPVPGNTGVFRFARLGDRSVWIAYEILARLASRDQSVENLFDRLLSVEIMEESLLPLFNSWQELHRGDREDMAAFLSSLLDSSRGDRQKSYLRRGFITYLLLRLGSEDAVRKVAAELHDESDRWIYRCAAIGSAMFGVQSGRKAEFINKYVDSMYEEMRSQNYGSQTDRRCNMGFHLTYYGDQLPPANRGRPDQDEGGAECSGTVRNLLRHLLDKERYGPIWRLNVATLVDLLTYSREDRLSNAMDALKRDERILSSAIAQLEASAVPREELVRLKVRLGELGVVSAERTPGCVECVRR